MVNMPRPGTQWAAVAATADNRGFIVAAQTAFDLMSKRNCGIWLYKLTLTPGGTPASLSPLHVPELSGQLGFTTLTASADGRTVAYASHSCDDSDSMETISVINTATAKTTTWTTPESRYPASLSLSADGRLLAFANLTYSDPSDVRSSAWVLRTDSPPGPVEQRGRAILRTPQAKHGGPQVDAVALSADGNTLFMVTQTTPDLSRPSFDTLAAYSVATGRRLAALHTFPGIVVSKCSITATPDTGHLILWNIYVAHTVRVDLATGTIRNFHDISASRVMPTTADGSLSPSGIAW